MKKILALLLVAVMAFGCAACAAQPAAEEPATEAPATEEAPAEEAPAEEAPAEEAPAEATTYNIGVCIYKFDDNFMTLLSPGAGELLQEPGDGHREV